jgi:hypothetical protein
MLGAPQQPELQVSVIQSSEGILLEMLAPNIRDIRRQFSFQQKRRFGGNVLPSSKELCQTIMHAFFL